MASENFAFGNGNDRLIQICTPGVNSIGLTGRELRRSKERRKALTESGKECNQQLVQKKGFK